MNYSHKISALLLLLTATTSACIKGQLSLHKVESDKRAAKLISGDCIDPDLTKVQKGNKLMLCDGSLAEGSLASCSSDGQQSCVTENAFKAADTTGLTAAKIAKGTTVAGVAGSKRDIKQCRSGANLSRFDFSSVPSTQRIPNRINSLAAANTLQFSWNHGLATNDPVQIYCNGTGTTLPGAGNVSTGITYYAIFNTANRIQLSATVAGAALGITGITGCSGSWAVLSPADNIASGFDTIDDYQGSFSFTTAPSTSPWGPDYLCNENNFKLVTGSSSTLNPSNTVPSLGNLTWSQIWQDELSGLYLTNVLYDGNSTMDWYSASQMCGDLDNLNGGAGGKGWRLPTQKELMQLFINGLSKVAIAGGGTDVYFWSSTAASYTVHTAWTVSLNYGYTSDTSRMDASKASLCVRD